MTTQSANDPGNAKNQEVNVPEKTENPLEDEEIDIDPASLLETTSQAEETADIDKLIGRGLKLPPVQSDGLW